MSDKVPLPTAAVIDPVNICNLSCHLCPTGQKKLNYPQSFMSFENFKMIISRFPELKTLELYNWGEPFLNPEIFDMINYTKEKKIFTQVHTNLSLNRDDSFFRSLALNSPHKLIISLDGASAESYRAFRVRGDFDLVIDNIKKIRRLQKECGTTSFIQWKYIVNSFNEHEIELARKTAEQIEVRIKFVPMSLGDDMIDLQQQESLETRKKRWLPVDSNYVLPQYQCVTSAQKKGTCPFLFQTIV
ncbi:MAG TPA: radical SAM protein, partial [Chitinispirillaceae bacterium]|nr:radical SAM protein [Chitinispirillaceae bacterium]